MDPANLMTAETAETQVAVDARDVWFTDTQVRAILGALDEWLTLHENEDPRRLAWAQVKQAADRMRIGLLP